MLLLLLARGLREVVTNLVLLMVVGEEGTKGCIDDVSSTTNVVDMDEFEATSVIVNSIDEDTLEGGVGTTK